MSTTDGPKTPPSSPWDGKAIDPAADTDRHVTELLREVGELPDLNHGPIPNFDPDLEIQRIHDPNRPSRPHPYDGRRIPYAVVLGIIDYMVKPEAVPYLGWIYVAPDFIVHASRLRWNAGIRDLEYHTLADGWVPLDRFHRSLLEGGTQDSDWRTEFFDEHRQGYVPPASLEFDPEVFRPIRDARFAAELGVTIYVTQHFRVADDGRLRSTGLYEATAERGDFRLIDLASGLVAVFTTLIEARDAADAALLHNSAKYVWAHPQVTRMLSSIPPELRLSPLEDRLAAEPTDSETADPDPTNP